MLLREFEHAVIHGSLPDNDQHAGPFFDQDLLGFLIAARDHDPVRHLVIFEILFVRHCENTHLSVEVPLIIIVMNLPCNSLGYILCRSILEH